MNNEEEKNLTPTCEHCEEEVEQEGDSCEECNECGCCASGNYTDGNGYVICAECDDNYIDCEDCGSKVHSDYTIMTEGGSCICEDCYENDYFTCGDCNEVLHNDCYSCDGYCSNCDRSQDYHFQAPDFDCDKYRGTRKGKIVKHKRMFGCELEMYGSEELSEKLCEFEGLGIVEDGSVNDGFEVVTPPITADLGEKFIQDICKVVNNDDNFDIDGDCGFHAHFDLTKDIIINDEINHRSRKLDKTILEGKMMNKLSFKRVQNLMLAYHLTEKIFYSLVSRSRRKNTYALPISNRYDIDYIKKPTNILDLQTLWYARYEWDFREDGEERYNSIKNCFERKKDFVEQSKDGKYHSSRYNYANFHSLFRNGTLEIRLHSGTGNARKILEWVNLHGLFIDKVINDESVFIRKLKRITKNDCEKKQLEMLMKELNLTKSSRDYLLQRQEGFTIKKTESR